MTHPYRTTNITTPSRPPWWQRTLARVFSHVALQPFATEWQWYRRARGGRWSLTVAITRGGGFDWTWRRVERCPGSMHSRVFIEGVPSGVCFDERALDLMIDQECDVIEHTARECFCEVWS